MLLMADENAFEDDPLAGGSYSQLLFGDDDDEIMGLDAVGCFNFSSRLSSENPLKMLCFGDYSKENDMTLVQNASRSSQKCVLTCSDSSPASSTTNCNNKINSLSKSNKKRNGSGKESSVLQDSPGATGNQRNCKKAKAIDSTAGHARVKKEKLGERITALQQLVSPFGKTDTASVLHEAMGYIRFLHDQVQVLCSPYLQRLPSSDHLSDPMENGQREPNKNLRSRGLCLVPVELTAHVADANGADFWSPAMVNNGPSDQ